MFLIQYTTVAQRKYFIIMQKRKKENSEKGLHWVHAVMGIKIYSKVFHE